VLAGLLLRVLVFAFVFAFAFALASASALVFVLALAVDLLLSPCGRGCRRQERGSGEAAALKHLQIA
jgi:hypothetical protein